MKKSKQLEQAKTHHTFAYLIITIAVLIGGGSLVLFTAFLYVGSFNITELGLKDVRALWLDSFLCLAFFVQHSSMIRKSFRQRLESCIPLHYQGTFYAILSGITLLLLIIFWQESTQTIVAVEELFRWLPRLAFFLSVVGLVWSARSLRSFDIVGSGRILAYIHKKRLPRMPFTIRGPYRYVRHPFYFFILVMIWSCPEISLDRLLFNCLWSIWIVAGTVLEERDLATEFGEDYSNYQKKIPMLIPWRIGAKAYDT